jgi:hypothetical protein
MGLAKVPEAPCQTRENTVQVKVCPSGKRFQVLGSIICTALSTPPIWNMATTGTMRTAKNISMPW